METMFHAMSVSKWHIKMSEKMTVLCFMYFLYSMIGSPIEARLVFCSQKSHFHPLHLLHNSSFFSISLYISAQLLFFKNGLLYAGVAQSILSYVHVLV